MRLFKRIGWHGIGALGKRPIYLWPYLPKMHFQCSYQVAILTDWIGQWDATHLRRCWDKLYQCNSELKPRQQLSNGTFPSILEQQLNWCSH